MPFDRGQDRDLLLRVGELVERVVVVAADERIDQHERIRRGVGDTADVLGPVGGIVFLLARLPVRMHRGPAPQSSCHLLQVHDAERSRAERNVEGCDRAGGAIE